MKLPWTTLGHFSALTHNIRYYAGIRYYRDIDNTPKAYITETEPRLHSLRLDTVIDEGLLWAQHPLEDMDLDIPKPATLPLEHYTNGFRTSCGIAQVKRRATSVIESVLAPPRLSGTVFGNDGYPVESHATRMGAFRAECVHKYEMPRALGDSQTPVVTTSYELPYTVQLNIEFGSKVHVMRFHLRDDGDASTVFWYCTRNYGTSKVFDGIVARLVRDAMKNRVDHPHNKMVTFRRRSCKFIGL